MWRFHFSTETWENLTPKVIGTVPARSRFSGAVYGDSLYIVAGWNRVSYFEDFYCFNFSNSTKFHSCPEVTIKTEKLSWTQIVNRDPKIKTPSISQHVVGVYNHFLVLYGGLFSNNKGELSSC